MKRERFPYPKGDVYLLIPISVVVLLVLFLCAGKSYAADMLSPPDAPAVPGGTVSPSPPAGTDRSADGWISWWGVPAKDALLLGMWSLHTSPDRHERNTTQNLVGLQYKGYFASTLKNSYYKQSYFAGIVRTVYLKGLARDVDFDISYKAGLIWGYQDHYPNVGGFTPLAFPTFGLTYRRFGVDFEIFPSEHPVFSINLRFNIDALTGRR